MLRLLLVANALLQVADAASTVYFLRAGTLQEGNPLVNALLDHGGLMAFLIVKVMVALAMLAFLPRISKLTQLEQRFTTMATGAFAVLMMAVIANNLLAPMFA